MNATDRKKVAVISKYAIESFAERDWFSLGQITGHLDIIKDHPRLLRSMSFGDDDYDYCANDVLNKVFSNDDSSIQDVIDYFDIDLWYSQKEPEKYKRVFGVSDSKVADFWHGGYLKAFISHLSSNKVRMSGLKSALATWGISAFVAHEDIQASREWRDEVEAGLETMDVLIAVVEPGFKESNWCAQEVGFALGRRVDILPLRAGMDPFGFFGKYQGIQAKGKNSKEIAQEVTEALLRKPQHRALLLQSIPKSFSKLASGKKIEMLSSFDSWSIATDEQIKATLENSALSEFEKTSLKLIIDRVGAFKAVASTPPGDWDDEIPF